jgi:hypothetical protein
MAPRLRRAEYASCFHPPTMTLDLKKARELCTEREFELVASSRPAPLRSMTPRVVRASMARARGLRDKFRDLAGRQAREARGKAAPRRRTPAKGNAATVAKAELFEEVARRFEGRAQALDLPTNGDGRGKRGSAASKARAPGAGGVQGGRTRWQAADARKETKVKTSPLPREQWHASSRNRRGQARRDSRISGGG